MKHLLVMISLMSLLAIVGLGQVVAVPVAAPAASQTSGSTAPLDQYRIGAGVTYDYYGKTGFASSVDIDARTSATSNIWYHVALDMTREQAVLRPGAEYELACKNLWCISLLGDAGLATGTGATLGAFSGGGKITYDFGSKLTKGASHYYAEFTVKILYISGQPSTTLPTSSQGVQPTFGVTFSKGL